jgi:hypothetical protein
MKESMYPKCRAITKKLLDAGRDENGEWKPRWHHDIRTGEIYSAAVSLVTGDAYKMSFFIEEYKGYLIIHGLEEQFLTTYERMVDEFINETDGGRFDLKKERGI